ncbi:MAG: ATP:cob(I)alamin adenosyltransferase, partial [Cystobacterineae bacterium]|nr:ATP:cob(I)alamin adenosyltransferase [Cystobacterineae bacterium]
MASITTKKGDGGQTSLYGGGRLPKHAPRIEAYGEIDELSTLLGLARASGVGAILEEKVVRIQEELMALGAVLATLPHSPAAPRLPPLLPAWAECMEAEMEVFERALPPLRQFVLPGGRGAPPPPCGHPPSLATRQGGA